MAGKSKKSELQKAANRGGRPKGSKTRPKSERDLERLNRNTQVGRPSSFTKEIGVEICAAIATSTRSIKQVCEDNEKFPTPQTVYRWLSQNREFLALYQQAKLDQSMILADELMWLADTPKIGQVTVSTIDAEGQPRIKEARRMDMLEHRKLQIATRQWLLARLRPREYGERIQVDNPDNPLNGLIEQFDKRNKLLERIPNPDAPTGT